MTEIVSKLWYRNCGLCSWRRSKLTIPGSYKGHRLEFHDFATEQGWHSTEWREKHIKTKKGGEDV
jgi:hypothetical protein